MSSTENNIFEIMAGVSGASFVGIDTLTKVTLKGGRKNVMQGRVTKVHTGAQVMVFQNKRINGYEAMVKRRLESEGKPATDFVLGERAWGERVPNLPIVKHFKDGVNKLYLEVIFLKAGTSEYFLDGEPIEKDAIEGLAEVEPSGQGGLENQVIIRTFALDSITAIRIDGDEFMGPFEG